MSKVITKVKLWNYADEVAVTLGVKKAEEVRSAEVDALVDTGATPLVLPKAVADQLGLVPTAQVTAVYADGRKVTKPKALGVGVEILGRRTDTAAVIEEHGTVVLIGHTLLQELDLVVDPKGGTLGPRPESPDMPMLEIFRLTF